MSKNLADLVYPERAFGGYSRRDGTVEFFTRVQSLLPESGTVLDIGCGRGKTADDPCSLRRRLTDLRGSERHVIGMDVDPVGEVNPTINEFRLIENVDVWPVESESIDLAVANAVVEHVEQPEKFMAEAWRVTKPGGYICIRTYNTWSYIGIASRLVPNRMHEKVTAQVQDGRKGEDVFPTVYRCNTRRKLLQALEGQGFRAVVYTHDAEPSYLQFSSLVYRLGAIAHSLMPPPLRWNLMAFAQKPA